MKQHLEHLGHEVVCAFDTELGHHMWSYANQKNEPYDLFIFDHDLGGGQQTGAAFAKQLYEEGSRKPVIMLTGNSWSDLSTIVGQAHPELGKPVAAYIKKGFNQFRDMEATLARLEKPAIGASDLER